MTNISRFFRLNRRGESQAHVVYAVTFTIIAVVALVGLIMMNTEADDSGQSVTISNAAPTFTGNVLFYQPEGDTDIQGNADAITPTEGTWTTYGVSGTVNDTNGCADFNADTTTAKWNLKIFRVATGTSGNDGASCVAGNASCLLDTYQHIGMGSCTDSITQTFTWAVDLPYYLQPSRGDNAPSVDDTWVARVAVTDAGSSTTTATTAAFEINELNALAVTPTTNYGTLALGATSASQTIALTNTGNLVQDYNVYSTDLTCDGLGSIPKASVKIKANTNGTVTTPMGALAGNNWAVLNDSVAVATSAVSTGTTHSVWMVTPSSNALGVCTGTATWAARPNSTIGD